jgi:hypothetical protein
MDARLGGTYGEIKMAREVIDFLTSPERQNSFGAFL